MEQTFYNQNRKKERKKCDRLLSPYIHTERLLRVANWSLLSFHQEAQPLCGVITFMCTNFLCFPYGAHVGSYLKQQKISER